MYNERVRSSLKDSKKTLWVFGLLFAYFIGLTPRVTAETEQAAYFSSSYDVIYEVSQEGKTLVTKNVRLTNLTTEYYAASGELTINSENLENIRAFDEAGEAKTFIEKKDGQTKIKVFFNEKVGGKGRVLNWRLNYETKEMALRTGRIWEINIPGVSGGKEIEDYKITLKVPKTFGEPAYIKSAVRELTLKSQEADKSVFVWEKAEVANSGVSLAFGDYQFLEFRLSYHLKNEKLYAFQTEIALPPTTAYQEIYLDSLEPKPQNIRIDEDGNWLALYVLKPGERLHIEAVGQAKLYLSPRQIYQGKKLEPKNSWLLPRNFWQVDNEEIRDLAKRLKTPRAIYDWIVTHLEYDYSRLGPGVERLGAEKAISMTKQAICMEFTDLFVALSRAAGIPARMVTGFAFSQNSRLRPLSLEKDILHAWPEYWDEEAGVWRMIDPTWAKTTQGIDYFDVLDFNHLAFAIRGRESDWPHPAGVYKLGQDEETKDVEISFDEFETKKFLENGLNPKVKVEFDLPSPLISGIGVDGRIRLENLGGILAENISVEFCDADQCYFLSPNVAALPPFGHHEVKTKLKIKNLNFEGPAKIKVRLGGDVFEKEVYFLPFYRSRVFLAGIGMLSAAAFFGGLFTIAKKHRGLSVL